MTQEEFKGEAMRLRPRLLQTASRYLGADEAEDTVQDVLLRLWQMADELRMPVDALAMVLTRNFCISALRRRGPQLAQLSEGAADVADDAVAADERIDRIMALIAQLPSMQQTILRLRHIEGMEVADIAALTGSSEVAVRKALSRARLSVRQKYMERYEPH